MRTTNRLKQRLSTMRRRAISSVGVATVVSVTFAVATWSALGVLFPGQAGFGAAGVGYGRGPILIAVGVFALTLFAWSRLQGKRDEER